MRERGGARVIAKWKRRRIDIKKAAVLAVVTNALQIIAVLALAVLVLTSHERDLSLEAERWLVLAGALVVTFGAVADIGSAMMNLRFKAQQDALEETYYQLEDLNRTMRAQRHDFMNHLQVVYSLIEMGEPKEATVYIDRVYGDMQRVSRVLRTDSAAVNALLQAKLADCEKRGIALTLGITSRYRDLKLPAWEMCRVLGNLIDNAMDAVAGEREKKITVELFEDLRNYGFRVSNNGPEIPPQQRASIFTPGFTTKRTGQGMGLYIVSSLLESCGGSIEVSSADGVTTFSGRVPRDAAQELPVAASGVQEEPKGKKT